MAMETSALTNTSTRRKFVCFRVGTSDYAFDVHDVKEVRWLGATTRLQSAPPFVLGTMEMEGTDVPVVDLRLKFQTGRARYRTFTQTIVVSVRGSTVGFVVDDVCDVAALDAADGQQVRVLDAGQLAAELAL